MPDVSPVSAGLDLRFLDAGVSVERRPDASMVLRTEVPFEPSDALVHGYLRQWALSRPHQKFLAERSADGAGWQAISYGEAFEAASRLATSFSARGLGDQRPILILSGNGITHQLVALAAMMAGVPYTPLSVAYSTMSGDLGKLRAILKVLDPGLVFAADAAPFARALAIDEMGGREVVIGRNDGSINGAVSLASLLATPIDDAVLDRAAKLPPQTIAKILFTSGSTGTPKGVPTTHRMMCTSLSQIETLWPFMRNRTPVILDWLPWSHVFGGSFSVNTVLRYCGTLYIDDGKPVPGEIARTHRNLREVRPTLYWNVPKGYELLLPLLEADSAACQNFYGALALMLYAGASLPAPLWRQLVTLGRRTTGRDIPMTTSWGLTETAPSITITNRAALAPGNIGIPMPGLELKLVPHQGKLEARVRGPNVTTGYWNAPEASAAAFDEEGFFRTGDAVVFADSDDATQGLIFDGRTMEDFKLLTGTWVDAAAIRLRAHAAFVGLITDVVVTGADRNEVGLLLICAAAHNPDDATFRAKLLAALADLNKGASGASQRVTRAIVMRQPPSFDSGEITEKGSLNARLIRERRADLVAALYSGNHPDVLLAG
ncbi:AMP-binding protein [Bradyrhizobium sp. LjRoot220]|uniref:AMP-binding protein n=1 Tax=Bradyrhizobium sp. LjRoot220 TaxID=3342284 RepID=UPI003ED16455